MKKCLKGIPALFLILSLSLVMQMHSIQTFAAPSSANIYYSKVPGGKYLYCNNPEEITNYDLGDSNLGNKIIYKESNISGKVQAFFSHVNSTGSTIYYGVQVYNPNSFAVTVTVSNKGYSVGDWSATDCWKQFYSGSNDTYTIGAKKAAWILKDDSKPISHGQVIDGVIRLQTSDCVDVNFYAYKSLSNINGTAVYEGYITRTEPSGGNETRVYKGSSSNPMLLGEFNWTLDSTTRVGYLPVTYTDGLGNTFNRNLWSTNITKAKSLDAILTDMFSFHTPGYGTVSPQGTDPSGAICNLGNWGVQYVERYTITNTDTSNKKTIQLRMAAPTTANHGISNVVFYTPEGFSSKSFNSGLEHTIYSFDVPPGETVTKEIHFVLTGHSGGKLNHCVYLSQTK